MADRTKWRQRCTAWSKQNNRQCTQNATPGTNVCFWHGGGHPYHQARKELAIQARKLGQPIPMDPGKALLSQVWEAAGNVVFWRDIVSKLNIPGDRSGQVVDLVPEDNKMLWGPDHKGDAAPHVAVHMYNQERERLAKMSTACINAGLAERQVRLEEEKGALVAKMVLRLLADPSLGLTPEQFEAGRQRAGDLMRELAEDEDE